MTDAEWQRWLERSGKHRCALFELTFFGEAVGSPSVGEEHHAYVSNYPYVTRGTDTPAHQEFDWCVLEAPSFTRRMGEQLEGRSTQSYGDLILSNEATLGDQGQLLEAGARDDWLSMNWDGRRVRMWLGDPGWPFADFRLVLDGRIVDVYDPGGYKIGFRIGDKAALLDRPIMATVLDGDGPQAGQLMPLAYGYVLKNITPRLIDQVDQVYRITQTDPGVEELYRDGVAVDNPFQVRENGVVLGAAYLLNSSDAGTNLLSTSPIEHGFVANTRIRLSDAGSTAAPSPLVFGTDYWVIASGLTLTDFKVAATRGGSAIDIVGAQTGTPVLSYFGWDNDFDAGTFQLAGNPAGLITCDAYGLTVLAGSPPLPDQIVTAGDIIYQALTSTITNTPLTSADIDGASLAAFVALCPQTLSIYITERMTFADLLDQLVLSVGGWWGFSREGLLQFGRLDLPSAGTPVYSFSTDDTARRSMKMLRRILPRAEVKVRGNINWTVQETVAGSVDSYQRADFANPYTETTGVVVPISWEDDPENHLSALRPEPYRTLLNTYYPATYQQDESDRLAVLFQEPNSIYGIDTHQAAYLLKIGDLIYNDHPKFTGYGTVVGLTEKVKGRSQVEFFCRKATANPSESIPPPADIWLPPGGPYVLVDGIQTFVSNNALNFTDFAAINTVEHNMLVVGFASATSNPASITVSDTAGNAYTVTSADTGGTGSIRWAYCMNARPHASNVITITHNAANYRSMCAYQFSGGSRVLDVRGTNYDAASATTIDTAAFSTTDIGVVLVGYTNPTLWGNFTSATFSGPESTSTLAGTMQQGNYGHMISTGAHASMQMSAAGCLNASRLISAIAFR